MNRTHIAAAAIALTTALSGVPAFAAEDPAPPENPATKLARGVANASFGWVEVSQQAALGSQQAGLPGFIAGLAKGVGTGAGRTLVGALEIGTFWAPIPEGHAPILNPPTVFEKER
jgi:putative exosortase-associated protein (TIGR04073 family)